METKRIAIIGTGNLGLSIAHGLLQDPDFDPKSLVATRRNVTNLADLAEKGVSVTNDNSAAVRASEIIIIAVKPYNVGPIIEEIKSALESGRHTIVSVATGITLKSIKDQVPDGVSVFRAMPNTATDVNESVTALAYNPTDQPQALAIEHVFNKIGATIHIHEDLMEAATVLGACGIAFVMRFIRAMVQGGIQIGFDAKTASAIVIQTVKGAAELLIERKDHPENEIDKVTTPRGCTIVGLNEMEHNGFSSSLIKGIVTSYEMIERK